jgi:hypothetical protein
MGAVARGGAVTSRRSSAGVGPLFRRASRTPTTARGRSPDLANGFGHAVQPDLGGEGIGRGRGTRGTGS